MNAKAITFAEASDRVSLNRYGNRPLSDKGSILQLNEGFTNGYRQVADKIDVRNAIAEIRPDACV